MPHTMYHSAPYDAVFEYDVANTSVNRPDFGMLNIPPMKIVIWRIVYYCFANRTVVDTCSVISILHKYDMTITS